MQNRDLNTISIASLLFFISFMQGALGHGFLYSPRPRGYQEISYAIDNLRNPTGQGSQCRGKSPDGAISTINIVPGGQFKVTLALSIGAEHIGHCSLELYNEQGTKKIDLASNVMGCASSNGFKQKSPGASSQCPGQIPQNLVTDDMCLKEWSVQLPSSLNGLDFNRGYLRWTWTAQHITPNEFFVNCADVIIEGVNSSGGYKETNSSSPSNNPSPSSPTKYSTTPSPSSQSQSLAQRKKHKHCKKTKKGKKCWYHYH